MVLPADSRRRRSSMPRRRRWTVGPGRVGTAILPGRSVGLLGENSRSGEYVQLRNGIAICSCIKCLEPPCYGRERITSLPRGRRWGTGAARVVTGSAAVRDLRRRTRRRACGKDGPMHAALSFLGAAMLILVGVVVVLATVILMLYEACWIVRLGHRLTRAAATVER